MLKIVFGWRDRPDLSAEACERHYREVHMPLARQAFDGAPGFLALVYNRVTSHSVNDYNQPTPRQREPDLNAFVELYMRDRASLDAAIRAGRLQRLFDDHANFMVVDEPENIRIYEVEETVFHGHRP